VRDGARNGSMDTEMASASGKFVLAPRPLKAETDVLVCMLDVHMIYRQQEPS